MKPQGEQEPSPEEVVRRQKAAFALSEQIEACTNPKINVVTSNALAVICVGQWVARS